MSKFFTLLLCVMTWGVFAQESYTTLKVVAPYTPKIDGDLDDVWSSVLIVPLQKVPKTGGDIHPNITEPEPSASDYSAEFGMLWGEKGMYFLFTVTDDVLVIEDDYYTENSIPADQWWTDDNVNILFSKDLVNSSFSQWEFAYQPGVDQEEKLSSSDWANPAVIDISLVETAWSQDGNTYTMETFISWDAFEGVTITPGMVIALEMRARDDDDGGAWESMFQWSTDNYDIENDGEGFGEVTLSEMEVDVASVKLTGFEDFDVTVYPNPTVENLKLRVSDNKFSTVQYKVLDLAGRQIIQSAPLQSGYGADEFIIETAMLEAGTYLLELSIDGETNAIQFIKK